MDVKYIHIGDHIRVTPNGHISLFGISIGDTVEKARLKLDDFGICYEYDKYNRYIQNTYHFDKFVFFDNANRSSDLSVCYHFSKDNICVKMEIASIDASLFSPIGHRFLADAIELFSSCLKFNHEYGKISNKGIIKVFKAGEEYIYISLDERFCISVLSKKEYKQRVPFPQI